MQIRTVAAILMWLAVVLLIVNSTLRSEWLWVITISIIIMAVIAYFIPKLRKPAVKS